MPRPPVTATTPEPATPTPADPSPAPPHTAAAVSANGARPGPSGGLRSSTNPSVFGGEVTLVATVGASAPGRPTGRVTFCDGASAIGEAALDEQATARLSTSGLGAGTHALTARYSGDANFASSVATQAQVVEPAPTMLELASPANPATFGSPVSFVATLRAAGPRPPDGRIAFFAGGATLGAVALDKQGQARVTVPSLEAGTVAVRAEYSGDDDFAPSSAALTQVVRFPSAVALSCRPNPSTFGQPVSVRVEVRSAAPGQATGRVALGRAGTSLGDAVLDESGAAELEGISLPAGQHAVEAHYEGDAFFAPASGGTTQRVERAPTTTTLRSSSGSDGTERD
ncbi:MAG: Ig-like domain-containing protein [Acidimicrobiales bacterium]